MAAYFWVGGNGTWDNTTTTNWASTSGGAGGAGVPTNADTATFDANSGTAAIVTVASTAVSLSSTVDKADINLSLSGSPTLCTAAGTLTLTTGTITLNNNTLSVGVLSSSNSNTRAIDFGSGNIALTSTGTAAIVLAMATATGFTWTGTGGFTRNQAATATMQFGSTAGGTTANAVNLTVNAGSQPLTITDLSFFKNVNFSGNSGSIQSSSINVCGNLTLGSGTYTSFNVRFNLSSTVTSNGKSIGGITLLNTGSPYTVTLADALTSVTSTQMSGGTLDLNGFSYSTTSFSSSVANTRSIIFGTSNITLTNTSAGSTVLFMTDATNFTYTGTGGFVHNATVDGIFVFGTTGGTTSNAPNLAINAGAGAITITTNSFFKNVVFTGSTSTVTATYNACGNLTLATGGTYTSVVPTFRANGTVTSSGKTVGNTNINGTGITVTLADAMTLTNTFTLTQGTLDLAGFTLSTGIFTSSNSNTRAITFGSGNIALTNTTASTTVLVMATATGFTWTGTGSFTRNMAATCGMSFGNSAGGTTTNAPNLTVNAGASALTINTGSYFKNLVFTGSTSTVTASGLNMAGNLTLASGGTYTSVVPTFLASGTVTSAGRALGNATVNGSGITVTLADAMTVGTGSTTTLTAGTLALAGFTLSTGIFSSSGSSTRAITFGSGNIALTSTTASTTVLAMATATGFTFTGTGGFTRNQAATATMLFGTTGGTTTNAPNLTVNAGASALTITGSPTTSWFKNVNFTGSTCTVSANGLSIAGNLTLASGGTYTSVVPTFVASGTITSAGRTLSDTTINGSGITVTLADAMTLGSASTLTLTQGTFTAANFNVTAGFFTSNNSNTRTLNMGSGTWTMSGSAFTAWNTATTTGMTLNPSTSTITLTSASSKTFSGGGLTYYNLNQGGAGVLTIFGSNTFNDITDTVQPSTVTFTAGTTQTVSNFSLAGTAGNLVTINSATPGSQFTLSKASGTVNAQYLSIQDSNATGGAVWNADATNVNGGNNLGWIFSATATGNMFLMFV
jgi:hypothetical protein